MEKESKDEFFGENEVQRAPAPTMAQSKKRTWVSILLVVCVVTASFFGGFFTRWYSLDDGLRTLKKIKDGIDDKYYQEVDDDAFYSVLFQTVNEEILDDYSYYMTAEEYNESVQAMQGKKSGVGLAFLRDKATGVTSMEIFSVCGNSPAEKAGVRAGDVVIGFGKTETEIKPSDSFAEFSAFLEGVEENTQIFLRLRLQEGERTVSLRRTAYVENYVFYRTNATGYALLGENATEWTETGNPLPTLGEDTAYIRLVQFSGNAKDGFDRAMAQFKTDGKKNLVLDLRGNGGGYVGVMQSIASYFCKTATEKTPVVAVADFGDDREEYRADRNVYADYFSSESKIYVLADTSTASASECLIGCMLDYGALGFDGVCLVGRNGEYKTFGKGIMQETRTLSLSKQDALKLTTAEIVWPTSHTSIHGRGILPQDGALTVDEEKDFEKETVSALSRLLGAGAR